MLQKYKTNNIMIFCTYIKGMYYKLVILKGPYIYLGFSEKLLSYCFIDLCYILNLFNFGP